MEFRLSPPLAERVYTYAKAQGLTLSQSGERLLDLALAEITGEADAHGCSHAQDGDRSTLEA
ncbi:hypothetical protein [Mycolicibacterium komossense]|uniref:Uncharacterized protein n=1 Tax=Mycolicibacterium komossense TaxID=1779 RepID=A0ABT3C5G3_9MYCO|nr:hypothetical protein [Mycolicibacterium komossense]MCV7224655.1 hypothetical protein [Mycolicibacterium komossense]